MTMTGPRVLPGLSVPLFDRLVDADTARTGGGDALMLLDRDALILSIALEISALLNTRCPRSRAAMAERARTTLDYGIPDISTFQPFDAGAEASLAAELEAAITAFEPRLLGPKVQVRRLSPVMRAAYVREWSDRTSRLPANQKLRDHGVWMTLMPSEHDHRALLVEIAGRIRLEDRIEPVSFPVALGSGNGAGDGAH